MSSRKNVVVSVRGLSKSYTIAHEQQKESTLAETLLKRVRHPFRRTAKETFWALKEVSFDIQKGEIVGVIRRNGAGKSTLLKVLSRITEPTAGKIDLFGQIGSLLEVGTGFHPELTGRENVFLNGAILGMAKTEIRKQFDEIVAFSGVEQFLDTPVKRYSSGMYVRLAFAVAAHLNPDILIIDEVLAVGDAEFQKRCLGKMKDVASDGRTVIFVSHNMQAVGTLCDTAIWMKSGQLVKQGMADSIINDYFKATTLGTSNEIPLINKPRTGSGTALFTKIRLGPAEGDLEQSAVFRPGDDLTIELDIKASEPLIASNIGVTLYDLNSYRLVDVSTALHGDFVSLPAGGSALVTFKLQNLLLKPGTYTIELWLGRHGIEDIDFVREAGQFEVSEDVAGARHTESFPGTYQCRFEHLIREL